MPYRAGTLGAPALSRRGAWALALVATFTMAISYVDRQTLAVLAPSVTTALGMTETQYGWLASAFSLAYLVGAPLAGQLIDHAGARRGLLVAVLVWSVVAAAHALAPGFSALFALRIALGLAEAPSFPGAAQTVQRALPPAERARGFGVLFTGSSIGAMLAPPLAVALAARGGFRLAFVGTAIVGLAWVPLWLVITGRPAARAALDRPADALERVERARFRDVLAHRAVRRAVLVVVSSAPVVAFFLLWGAKYLVRDYHQTQTTVARFLWLPPLLYDAGSVLFGHAASRRAHARRTDRADAPLFALAAVLAAGGTVSAPFAPGPWSTMLLAGVALAGVGALFALLTTEMLARVPANAVSTAGGITAAAQSLAYVIANPLIGRGVEHFHSFREVLLALAAWTVPGTVAWLLWPGRASRAAGVR